LNMLINQAKIGAKSIPKVIDKQGLGITRITSSMVGW
jgi:hypothetical protein